MTASTPADDFCAGCAIECLCDTSKYEELSDAQLDAIAALDVNFADDASVDREQDRLNTLRSDRV